MTRDELIKAIYDSEEAWSCPDRPCEIVDESWENNCMKCAEKQLAEYEAKIRADAIDECRKILSAIFKYYRDEYHFGVTFNGMCNSIDDRLERLKEQKK